MTSLRDRYEKRVKKREDYGLRKKIAREGRAYGTRGSGSYIDGEYGRYQRDRDTKSPEYILAHFNLVLSGLDGFTKRLRSGEKSPKLMEDTYATLEGGRELLGEYRVQVDPSDEKDAQVKKMAQAVLNRAVRLSNIAQYDLSFDKKIVDLAEAIELGYGVKPHKALEATLAVTLIGLLGGIFFLSPNVTGNAIAGLENPASNLLGAGSLIVGLVAGLFYLKKKMK